MNLVAQLPLHWQGSGSGHDPLLGDGKRGWFASSRRLVSGIVLTLVTCLAVSSCTGLGVVPNPATDGELRVVTTTGILADLVRNVAGDRAKVSQLVPNGADPHSYEPTLRAIRDVAYADLAFSNYLLLEEHAIIKALDANLPRSAVSVSIAEEAAKAGATILPLVEDRALDTAWLGMRVAGNGSQYGANRASEIDLSVVDVSGPGNASAYITTTFGEPEIGFTSSDGFDAGDGYSADTTTLPADAHQHMSWAFTAPGIYRVKLKASLHIADGERPIALTGGTAVFAVGVDAATIAAQESREVFSAGHGDVTVDLDAGQVTFMRDATEADAAANTVAGAATVSGMLTKNLDDVVIEVPSRTLSEVPSTPGFRFLGKPGQQVYLLPQAVLGKHVHGEIDPHLWHDAHNAAAYVRVIRDKLIAVDPAGAKEYRANAENYLARIEQVDAQVTDIIATIPEKNRQLVTTNDAYAYLANAYGLKIAGFVAPNPAVEPSLADRMRLSATIKDLDIPAVFLEPNLARTRSTLKIVAQESGIKVCPLYGDTLDNAVSTYLDLMRFNANSLARCLGGKPDGN